MNGVLLFFTSECSYAACIVIHMRFTSYSNSSTVVSLPSVSPGTSVPEGGTFVVDVEVDPPPGGLVSDLTVTLAITDGTTSKTM